jgi:hypothetical protein
VKTELLYTYDPRGRFDKTGQGGDVSNNKNNMYAHQPGFKKGKMLLGAWVNYFQQANRGVLPGENLKGFPTDDPSIDIDRTDQVGVTHLNIVEKNIDDFIRAF